jgi:hypothetical protein
MADCAAHGDCRNNEGYGCFTLQGSVGSLCFRGCGDGITCTAGYACSPESQYCVPSCTDAFCNQQGLDCDATSGLCIEPPCTAGSCGNGLVCNQSSGYCVPDLDGGPGAGPGPVCNNLPERDCTGSAAYCSELIQYSPTQGPGYDDYPINGETAGNQWRSWARRDQVMLVKWAAAFVDCKGANWGGGNGHPLGLGDMSEQNGAIPGTATGQPGHPQGTHVNGSDIDMAYYQNTGPNNYLRAVCDHTQNGQDAYHCVSEPYLLDLWRNALFIGALFDSPMTRVIGVDGKIGALVTEAMQVLCADGWLPESNCSVVANYSLAYELTDGGAGWYAFHHHHMHLSLWGIGSAMQQTPGMPCLTADCASQSFLEHLKLHEVPGHGHNRKYELDWTDAIPDF